MLYLSNAFALSMLPSRIMDIRVYPLSDAAHAAAELGDGPWVSVVGHEDTAVIFTSMLGTDVPANRVTLALEAGDRLIVGQYFGPRLPVGTTVLPEGAAIRWMEVEIMEPPVRSSPCLPLPRLPSKGMGSF